MPPLKEQHTTLFHKNAGLSFTSSECPSKVLHNVFMISQKFIYFNFFLGYAIICLSKNKNSNDI